MAETSLTRYELPPQGITLLGYIARRMHKTRLLVPIAGMLSAGNSAAALEQVAWYAAAASVSYGPAYYQPRFNRLGEELVEADPATGWDVWARLEAVSPHYLIAYRALAPDGSAVFSGREEITGTTIGLRGLGMPAPSKFHFTCGGYQATLTGVITSELVLSLFGPTRIRAHGFLNLADSAGNSGKLRLDRRGKLTLEINGQPPIMYALDQDTN
ncbi:MAG: hypothetical protein NZP74_00965 [Anaerolineales bacterium]|nr:hypothetical protein [Anaerolineales bacterium]MDW8278283.1 hypothetical protein [Anaerolineales bacterium]